MSSREAYVPPVSQSSQQQQAASNYSGSWTPNRSSQRESSTAPANDANGEEDSININNNNNEDDDTHILYQSNIRRTNIVNSSQATASFSQTESFPFRPRVNSDRAAYATLDKKVYYICATCGLRSGFKANDMLRCLNCGGMTMLKPRVKRYGYHVVD